MNYIKEAEQRLYHYKDLQKSIDNIDKRIAKLKWSGPKDVSATDMDITGIHGGKSQDDAVNIFYEIQTLLKEREQTESALKEVTDILDEINNEPEYDNYGQVLKMWYMRRLDKEEIADRLGYSVRNIYKLRDKAIRVFAIRLFGINTLKVV